MQINKKGYMKYWKYYLGFVVLLFLFFAAKYFYQEQKYNAEKQEGIYVDSTEVKQKHLKYGFPLDDFVIINSTIKKNESLSVILSKYNVSYSQIDKIAKKAKEVFDLRKIRTKKKYSILSSKDSLNVAEYFIYENTSTEYIVFDLKDEPNVYKGEKEVVYVRKYVSGELTSSLWNALLAKKANPYLAIQLSDIYAWTVDFLGVGKGDKFIIIYDEAQVEGKSIGQQKIIASNYYHLGQNNYAFNFQGAVNFGYFDEKGGSLQKAFLKAPLKFSRISSHFTNRRFHPVLKRYRAHHGVDYAAPAGTPVHTIGDGLVIKKGYQRRGGGNYLKIKHNSVYTTTYMHLLRFYKGIKVGDRVKQGQTIAYVGSTGLSTGPHLDFRVFKNGVPINPLKVKSPPIAPVGKEKMAEFVLFRNKYLPKIDSLMQQLELPKENIQKDSLIK